MNITIISFVRVFKLWPMTARAEDTMSSWLSLVYASDPLQVCNAACPGKADNPRMNFPRVQGEHLKRNGFHRHPFSGKNVNLIRMDSPVSARKCPRERFVDFVLVRLISHMRATSTFYVEFLLCSLCRCKKKNFQELTTCPTLGSNSRFNIAKQL